MCLRLGQSTHPLNSLKDAPSYLPIFHPIFQVELIRRDYFANEGWETFLSYEDPERDILVGLLRLRKPSDEVFRSVESLSPMNDVR